MIDLGMMHVIFWHTICWESAISELVVAFAPNIIASPCLANYLLVVSLPVVLIAISSFYWMWDWVFSSHIHCIKLTNCYAKLHDCLKVMNGYCAGLITE